MCGHVGHKIGAAILAAIGLTVIFSAVWEQFLNPSLGNPAIVAIFLKYLVALLFLGAAKMLMWKSWHEKKEMMVPAKPARRRRR